MKPIDIYAIGFEEMVDLDAKNIVNARYVCWLQWALPFFENILEEHNQITLLKFMFYISVLIMQNNGQVNWWKFSTVTKSIHW